MQNCDIFYFSGTGNTARAAGIMKDYFISRGVSARMFEVDSWLKSAPLPGALAVFMFPVYAFQPPQLMARFIRKLPKFRGQRAAVFAVYGNISPDKKGYEGAALSFAREILSARGYDVIFADSAGYPSSFTQIVPPPEPAVAGRIIADSDAAVVAAAKRIENGERYIKPCHPAMLFVARISGWIFTALGRRQCGKLYASDNQCVSCGACVAACPAGAIKLAGARPRWNYSCQACQRCINLCPQAAIQTSLARLIVQFGLLFVPYYRLVGLSGAGLPIKFVVWVFGYALFWMAADYLLFKLEKTPLAPVACFNFTQKYRRYLAPGFRRGQIPPRSF